MAGAIRWGWHRLDPRWLARLIALAGVVPGDLVVDVGAGDGAITAALLERGASVVAVELHAGRAAGLRERFAGQRVVVVRADAATFRFPRRPFKVVANPPFGVTTSLLRGMTRPASRLDVAALVVPSYAAARWSGGRGAGGRATAVRHSFERVGVVPRRAFRPPPPADASVLVIRAR